MRRAQAGRRVAHDHVDRNIVAVATLTDVVGHRADRGRAADEGVAELAEARGVNLLGSAADTLETGAALLERLST